MKKRPGILTKIKINNINYLAYCTHDIIYFHNSNKRVTISIMDDNCINEGERLVITCKINNDHNNSPYL